MARRLTDAEVVAIYGDVLKFRQEDGTLSAMWGATHLTRFKLPGPIPYIDGGIVRQVLCHVLVWKELFGIFNTIYAQPEAWQSINDYGGCFEFRRNRNDQSAISRHAWGIAVDIDVKDNPNGAKGDMHPGVIKAFKDAGWVWGGDFHKPDPMHFEKGI